MQRPNVLILYTDQQRWDALGAAGNPEIRTPNLDRLASAGTMFSHHFVQAPVCMPSRASFLSGRYPASIGITHMGVPLPQDLPLLPHYLRNYGYRTANIGKIHALPHANRDHREPHPSYGFDHLEISDEPGPYEDAYRSWVRAKAPDELDHISAGLPPSAAVWQRTMGVKDGIAHPPDRLPKQAVPFPGRDDLTHSAFVGEQTRAFIAQQARLPWLCIAGFYSPHSPWIVPRKYLDLYDPATLTLPPPEVRAAQPPSKMQRESAPAGQSDDELRSVMHGYYAMVSEVDDQIGQILELVERQGMTDDTMIVFTSDHGEWLGKYGRYGKGHPADDTVSRVPLIIKPPARYASRTPVVDHLVEAIDVLPTVLEVAGIPIPPVLQGRSLCPLWMNEESSAASWRESALTEHGVWKTLRTTHHRYLVEASGAEGLYDLDRDPHGIDNIAGEPEAGTVLAEHRLLLVQRLLERERPLARTWTY